MYRFLLEDSFSGIDAIQSVDQWIPRDTGEALSFSTVRYDSAFAMPSFMPMMARLEDILPVQENIDFEDGGHACSICGQGHEDDDHDEKYDPKLDSDDGGPTITYEADDFSGDATTTGSISGGQQVTGTIDEAGDTDWFAIQMTAGATYVIDLFGNTASGTDELEDPFLRLFDSNGNQIAFNDDTNGLDSQITFTATGNVTYYISAEAFGTNVGDYVLSVQEDVPEPPEPINPNDATQIAIGGRFSGTLDAAGEVDLFSIDVVAGESYTVFMIRDTLDALDNPALGLFLADGTQIGFNDDVAQFDWNSRLDFTATETGTLYLKASSTDGENTTFPNADPTGGYTVYVETSDERADFTSDEVANYLVNSFSPFADSWGSNTITYDVSALPGPAQTLALLAMQAWADLTPLNFVEATGGQAANITFQDTDQGRAYATSLGPNGSNQVTINVASNWSGGLATNPDGSLDTDPFANVDDYTFQTYLHEVGHALGLGHSGSYNAGDGNPINYEFSRLYNQDFWTETIMSYFAQSEAGTGSYRFVLSPQIADILAIQSLYGANTTTRNGDTTYGFNSTEGGTVYDFTMFNGAPPAVTLYDTGGIDTIDLSGYGGDQLINLTAEMRSTIGGTASTPALAFIMNIARGTVIENAIGGTGDDELIGNSADNELRGGDGDDILTGNGGLDSYFGGNGSDMVSLLGETAGATIDIKAMTATTTAGTVTLSSIENGRGTDFDDVLRGDNFVNILEGEGGDDIMFGRTGDDIMRGGDGNDLMLGENGNDTLEGDDGNDIIRGGIGDDTLVGGEGNDRLYGENGNDTVDGGAGADRIYTQTGDDVIDGGAGADIINAGANNDIVRGGTENDTIYLGAGDDVGYGDDGDDVIYSQNGNDEVYGGLGNDNISGGFGQDDIFGEDGNDRLLGGAENDTVDGGAGDDTIFGQSGNDVLFGRDGADLVNGGTGDDFLYGGDGNDTLIGGNNNDLLVGGSGNDTLFGGFGNDTINGGAGTNNVYGDAGADTFDRSGAGTDIIQDFEQGTDKIALNDSLSDFDDLLANATDTAQGVQIANGSDGFYVIAGLTIADLIESDFIFDTGVA